MSELQPIITPADLKEDRAGRPQLCPIPAGWPSPAENYVEATLDLHRLAVPNGCLVSITEEAKALRFQSRETYLSELHT